MTAAAHSSKKPPKAFNREQWLQDAIVLLQRHVFGPCGHTLPQVQVAVGFPSRTRKGRVIGECWTTKAGPKVVPSILISPKLSTPLLVLGTLIHELVHALHPRAGHRGEFKSTATAVGLVGPMRATRLGHDLQTLLKDKVIPKLPAWESRVLDPAKAKKQSTRLLKCWCRDCGYIARVTAKWIDDVGTPECPCGNGPMDWTF